MELIINSEGSDTHALTEVVVSYQNATQNAHQIATASAITWGVRGAEPPAIVAYVIECFIATGAYTDQPNMSTEYGAAEQNKLHQLFIGLIANDMYEFCSAKHGHGISIQSYDEYCYNYAEKNGIFRYSPLYMMRYYLDGVWKTWDPVMYDNEIYREYLRRVNVY